jgi:hypothetical protein
MGAEQMGARRRARGLRRAVSAVVGCLGLVLAGMVPAAPASAQGTPAGCAAPATGQTTCAGLITPGSTAVAADAVQPESSGAAASLPPGLGPLSLRYAYGLEFSALTGGVGQTVAVVTEYGDSTAESDMATYRSEYSIPACGSGCFSVVDENGGTNYPPAGPAGWTLATAQSLDMISAICPNCHILLVEAGVTTDGSTTVGITDLGAAENTAVSLGAKFVTNTWFTPETTFNTSEPTYDTDYFNHPGVAITAPDGSAGGYGTNYPAASPDVIAVGGTTLTRDTSVARGWTETAYSGTGSGCSPYETKQPWQTATGCPVSTERMLNDVAAVADPSGSPVAAYDSSSGGWVEGGGGDQASAIIAAAFALAGTPAAGSYPASYLYAHDSADLVNDITSGGNGPCPTSILCLAGPGWDGPTGVGTPASASALGAQAPDVLGGNTANFDPATGNTELYASGTPSAESGAVWQHYGSTWDSLGGNVYGPPTVSYDPASGAMEAYALGTTYTIWEDAWVPGTGWKGWGNLGGPQTIGAPVVVYNPLNQSQNVFVIATDGTTFQDSWTASAGWSGWTNLSGITGFENVAYDPATQSLVMVGESATGVVYADRWTLSAGWSGWQGLGGDLLGPISLVYDPGNNGNFEVYAENGSETSNSVEETWLAADGSWAGWHDLGSSVGNGWPVALYNPLNGAVSVFLTGANGTTVYEATGTPGVGWSGWVSLGGDMSSGEVVTYDPSGGGLDLFGITASSEIQQDTWTPSAGWSGWKDLGTSTYGYL